MKEVRRGEIYYANLDPVVGSEQGGYRPVLIVQNDVGNKYSPTTIVLPITSRKKTPLRTHHQIRTLESLSPQSISLAEQIKTIDKSRIKEYVGQISTDEMKEIDQTIKVSVEI